VGEEVGKKPGHLVSEKIEMTGIVTRTYPKSAPETYYTFTRKKNSDSFDSKEK
jgi:hypothetical protein